ncbi:MAG: ABC-type transport auxiliary lipoprotein family protein [Desulfobacterales bacterium]
MTHYLRSFSWKAGAGLALASTLAGLLLGCGEILPRPGPAPELFVLSPKSTFPPELPRIDAQLVIAEPTSGGALNTDRIVLKPSPRQIKYVAGVRWVTLAPKMIQTLLVESFENSGKIVAVGRQAVTLQSDYLLISELREFQAEFTEDQALPEVVVALSVRIIRQPAARIVNAHTFRAVVTAGDGDMEAIVQAFDSALGKVLKQMVIWTLDAVATAEG